MEHGLPYILSLMWTEGSGAKQVLPSQEMAQRRISAGLPGVQPGETALQTVWHTHVRRLWK
jgi:hypothetical protein